MQELLTREERDRLAERLLPGGKIPLRMVEKGREGMEGNAVFGFLCRGMGLGLLHSGVRSGLDG